MTPTEIMAAFRALPLHRRLEAMRIACEDAIAVWERYIKDGTAIVYIDGVVGMEHVVDVSLPERALAAIDRKLGGGTANTAEIWDAYREPITALQDDDLDFPDAIALAYYAIYNLFGLVFECTKLYDEGETVIRQAVRSDDALVEWWTRTWDRWASRRDVTYPPSELDDATFEALSDGELGQAIERCAHGTRLHAGLLALAGRTAEAGALAAALGLADVPLTHIASSDVLVVGERFYTAVCGERYIVRAVQGNAKRMSGRCGFTIRRVAMSRVLVVFAGELRDDLGPYKSIVAGEELETSDYGYRTEYLGARTILAVGPRAELVTSEGILTASGFERFDVPVQGAVLDADWLVIYADRTYTLVERRERRHVTRELASGIKHAILVEDRVWFTCQDGSVKVVRL